VASAELVVPAAPAGTPGSIIQRIAAERHTETAQQPIVSVAQLVATLSPTVRPAPGTRLAARAEIRPAIAAEPAATA